MQSQCLNWQKNWEQIALFWGRFHLVVEQEKIKIGQLYNEIEQLIK